MPQQRHAEIVGRYKKIFAWELARPQRYLTSLMYTRLRGQQAWFDLRDQQHIFNNVCYVKTPTASDNKHASEGDTTTPPAKTPPTRQTPSTTASLSDVPPRAHTNLGLSCFINAALLALYAPTAVAVQLRALADACAADYLHL